MSAPTTDKHRKESSLHRSLKFRYSGPGGAIEKTMGNYVCDGQTSKGEIIEVQTGSFGPLKEKVKHLNTKAKVRIIHPIAKQKQIELYSAGGKLLRSRKSPVKGSCFDIFKVLIYAPELPLLKNLTIELAVIDVVEKRIDDGSGSWRRKGVRIADRFLGALHQSVVLKSLKDYRQFIPFGKNESFTVKDLAQKAAIKYSLAQKTIYTLSKMGLIIKAGKQGRALVYKPCSGS